MRQRTISRRVWPSDFYAQVRARGQAPDSEIRLRKHIVKLKELRTKDATELTQLRADVEHLVRTVNQLTAHNRELLHALFQPTPPPRPGAADGRQILKVLPGWCSSAGMLLIKRGSWRRPVEPVEGDEVLAVVQVDVVRARDDREATAGGGPAGAMCGGRSPRNLLGGLRFCGRLVLRAGVGRAGGLQSRARGPAATPRAWAY
ncbi:hypothetical protein GCM10010313_13940 [Streptomyces violarus]|nr:hypothetical protein GCM10010313_13940 [Streptomyces violarus]